MAFSFNLPTTSKLSLSTYISCDSHPSLTHAASSARTLLRQALKAYKTLPQNSQARSSALQHVQTAVINYLSYLLVLDNALSGKQVDGEDIVITLSAELEVYWRSGVAATSPGRQPPRIKGRGLDYEVLFTLVTGAYAYCLEARALAASLLMPSGQIEQQQRKANANAASNALLVAQSFFAKALSIAEGLPFGALPAAAVDIQPSTLSAMSSLCMASATLLVVVKDDDFLAIAAQARDSTNREWMYKAPDIPKVRANLFVRFCIAASNHAATADALLSSEKGDVRDDLLRFARNLQATSRARAYRFLGVDAELSGKLGDALGYINAAKRILGLPVTTNTLNAQKTKFKPSLSKFKQDWSERKERKEVEGKVAPSVDDSGKLEEGRVLAMLEKDWSKTNDMIHHQLVTDDASLTQSVPSAREFHQPKLWSQPTLEAGRLENLRAPPDGSDEGGESADSEDELEGEHLPGSFPNPNTGTSGYY